MSYRERENRRALAAEASAAFAALTDAIGELQAYRVLAPRMMADLPDRLGLDAFGVLALEAEIQAHIAALEARVASFHDHPLADQLVTLAEAFVAIG